jgi:hypothetical protein
MRDYLPLLGLFMFAIPVFLMSIWAQNKSWELRKEEEEEFYRQIYGPAGKPKKPAEDSQPEAR